MPTFLPGLSLPETFEAWKAVFLAQKGRDCLGLGAEKPMGYVGVDSKELAHALLLKVTARAGVDGFIEESEWDGVWWVTAWDTHALLPLLRRGSAVLEGAGWLEPHTCRGFADRVRRELAPKPSALRDLISDAYGDLAHPGRTEFQSASWKPSMVQWLKDAPY